MAIQFGSRFLLWLQPMAYSRGPFQQVVEYAWQNSGPPPGIIKSKTFKPENVLKTIYKLTAMNYSFFIS